MQNLWYLVAAYGMMWALLFVYVFSIARRQQRLREELMALEAGATGAVAGPADADGASSEEVRTTART